MKPLFKIINALAIAIPLAAAVVDILKACGEVCCVLATLQGYGTELSGDL